MFVNTALFRGIHDRELLVEITIAFLASFFQSICLYDVTLHEEFSFQTTT